ncbi:MAG: hypothetical protein UY09_C0012G0031 [Parcubacteria group bacterium GW2011_GWA2_47_8]|nr:MAG: hypothetical protein UY09_C0012G0031 [Parcubacteria group bacterium GW2011_GWA2_47_8]OHB20860.1 MAG: hypothetical protein A2666_04400 [Parcubacteria group bacterium RIFCSPHIGHO2_01_FULL_47_10b]
MPFQEGQSPRQESKTGLTPEELEEYKQLTHELADDVSAMEYVLVEGKKADVDTRLAKLSLEEWSTKQRRLEDLKAKMPHEETMLEMFLKKKEGSDGTE